jgi:YegS/Rv2252/BmrU family lipid kinase
MGNGADVAQIITWLVPDDFDVHIKHTTRPQHATELTKEAIASGADTVVAVGGDGTVNEVGCGLINSDVALGVIPCGSGNGFARHLKIPMSLKGAVKRVIANECRTIDSAEINGIPYFATAGLGFDAEVGWQFADFGKRGFISYVQVTTQAFFKFKPKTYHLIIDGQKRETTAFLINFANAGQYGNNAWIAPSASLSDGLIDVCILKSFPIGHVPGILFRLFNKTLTQSKYYEVIRAKEIEVIDPTKYHIDGEPMRTDGHMTIRVVPNSLKVIV